MSSRGGISGVFLKWKDGVGHAQVIAGEVYSFKPMTLSNHNPVSVILIHLDASSF